MNGGQALEEGDRDRWVKIIERCTRDLHDRVEMQQNVLLAILGKITSPPPLDPGATPDSQHKKLYRVLVETIEVLEETKKSFKSKRLEELRKRLMEVLKETA
jgi:hypothetical protein